MCLQILKHNIKLQTPFSYLYFLCLNGILFNEECLFDENNKIVMRSNPLENLGINNKLYGLDKLYRMCFDVLEIIILGKLLIILEINYFKFPAFKLACSIVSIVRELFGYKPWNKRLEAIYKINFEKDLFKCYEFVKR